MQIYDQKIKDLLSESIIKLEEHFNADVIFYYGAIFDGLQKPFKDFIEHTVQNSKTKDGSTQKRLIFFLKTGGGSVEVTEVIADLIRHHYQEVYFVIPDFAMSAGTILCMSGDKIYMDYSSFLGPIDPQLYNANTAVPVMGYIEKCQQIFQKSLDGKLSDAEFLMLKQLDLAFLSRCEHACELAKSLITDWLSTYLLKDDKAKAKLAADALNEISLWHSHGRYIGITKLKKIVGVPVEDYTENKELTKLIRDYSDLLTQFVERQKQVVFFHSRTYF